MAQPYRVRIAARLSFIISIEIAPVRDEFFRLIGRSDPNTGRGSGLWCLQLFHRRQTWPRVIIFGPRRAKVLREVAGWWQDRYRVRHS
jgi:hypothetical protein